MILIRSLQATPRGAQPTPRATPRGAATAATAATAGGFDMDATASALRLSLANHRLESPRGPGSPSRLSARSSGNTPRSGTDLAMLEVLRLSSQPAMGSKTQGFRCQHLNPAPGNTAVELHAGSAQRPCGAALEELYQLSSLCMLGIWGATSAAAYGRSNNAFMHSTWLAWKCCCRGEKPLAE